MVVDGNEGAGFELPKVIEPIFGPNDNRVGYVAKMDENWFVVINNQFGPFYGDIGEKSLVLSADGVRYAYVAGKDKDWFVVVNDQPGPFYDGITVGSPAFSPDGKRLVYGATRKNKWFAVVDGVVGPQFDSIEYAPGFQPR
jgi:hypothetical protein